MSRLLVIRAILAIINDLDACQLNLKMSFLNHVNEEIPNILEVDCISGEDRLFLP